jgi:hypothetical protein
MSCLLAECIDMQKEENNNKKEKKKMAACYRE